MEKLMITMIRVWLEKAWEREYNLPVAWLLGQPPSLLHCCTVALLRCWLTKLHCRSTDLQCTVLSPLHSCAAQITWTQHSVFSVSFFHLTAHWMEQHIVLQVIYSSQLHFLPRQRCASQGFHCTESKARLAGGRLLLNVHRRWADYLLVGRD